MILIKQIELLQRAHKLIARSQTGRPKMFSEYLGISERRLYDVIDEMKAMGAPIGYSDIHKTYYYKRACDVKIECSFRCLSEDEEQDTFGGTISISFYLFYSINYSIPDLLG